jgi:hypothetical protein
MQMTDNDADDDAITQATGDDAYDNDAAADINTASKTTRWRNNQPEKRQGRPWCDKVAVAVAVYVDRGNGYSVLLAVCSAICPASFCHVLPFCMGQNIMANEWIFYAIHL